MSVEAALFRVALLPRSAGKRARKGAPKKAYPKNTGGSSHGYPRIIQLVVENTIKKKERK